MNELEIVAKHATRAPVELGPVFQELGVDFRALPISSGESGWIERDGDRFSVVVNSMEAKQRQRFTAAHELAHYLLHRDLMDGGRRLKRHTDRLYDGPQNNPPEPFSPMEEVQANKLAAQIIMPARLVREYAARGLSVAELAKAFEVSKAAMQIRLKTLGLAPA